MRFNDSGYWDWNLETWKKEYCSSYFYGKYWRIAIGILAIGNDEMYINWPKVVYIAIWPLWWPWSKNCDHSLPYWKIYKEVRYGA